MRHLNVYTVSFFGHRHIENPLSIEKKLESIISSLLLQKAYVEFLVGRDGDFDLLVSSIIHRCQRKIRADNSAHVWVLPYETSEFKKYADDYRHYYNEIEICEAASKSHFKTAFAIRNQRMIDRSDLAVFYVTHNSGGAHQTMCYAQKKCVPIINLLDTKEQEEP